MKAKTTTETTDFVVVEERLGRTSTIKVRAHRADTPRIIGRAGVHVRALSAIVAAISERNKVPIRLQVLEPVTGQSDRFGAFEALEDWPRETVKDICEELASALFFGPICVTIHDGSDGQIVVEIAVYHTESEAYVAALTPHIQALLEGVGKKMGRLLTLDMHR